MSDIQFNRFLFNPIEYLKGVGPQKGDLLKKELQIFTIGNLLQHFPFRYLDKTKIHKISQVTTDQPYIQLKGKIVGMSTAGEGRNKRLVAKLRDETGIVDLVWFQGVKWASSYIQPNLEYYVFGKPSSFNGKLNFVHPELEPALGRSTDAALTLYPVYNSTEKLKNRGLDSKGISRLTQTLIADLREQDVQEILPASVLEKYKLVNRYTAYRNIHFPPDERELKKAEARLKFEEFFLIQVKLLSEKINVLEDTSGFVFEKIDDVFDRFYKNNMPFELTNAQKRVLKEIRKNVLSGKQMNRLIQGDVGSGKTIVALMAMLMAIDNGFQAALMAPTEILAQQHFSGIKEMVSGLGLKVALLTGSVKGSARKTLLKLLKEKELDILIGTHALIEDEVDFGNLGIAVIDEQHRFGVAQRARLWTKNYLPPHIIVMTATPIPRTLAMTVYGDLDVSVIDELPPGRKLVQTQHYFDNHRLKVFGFIRREIDKGRQVYVVYPLIEESEKMDLKDLTDGYESMVRAFPQPQFQISIVHGRMKAEERDFEMQRFLKKETQIMVATTVIEVGVNVPNASVMVIENAERFGLSQLHQLRGRVGRGADQSYCILMTGHKLTSEARTRIKTMTSTNDGFQISEVDLRLRGPGDLAGTQQSGVLDLRLASLTKDVKILEAARETALEVLQKDPSLSLPENERLKLYLERQKNKSSDWSRIS